MARYRAAERERKRRKRSAETISKVLALPAPTDPTNEALSSAPLNAEATTMPKPGANTATTAPAVEAPLGSIKVSLTFPP
jgi:hypothetical protein